MQLQRNPELFLERKNDKTIENLIENQSKQGM